MKKILLYIAILFSLTEFAPARTAYLIDVDGGIGPATAAYIISGIEEAERKNLECVVLRLNTPGGLVESTRDIVESILESSVPVIVYVAPGGARAGSAGVFITLAGNVAAMAPGTNIGAAHPVGAGGQSDTSAVMEEKITNDVAAFVRTIAQKRGRNVEWAEKAVRESISATENEALEIGVIDYIAPTLDSLFAAANGRIVEVGGGIEKTLNTAEIEIERREMNWREKLLAAISDPNVAYLFLMLGMLGIFFEFSNPGAIYPGVIGGLSILVAAYSMQMLPINYVGVALIIAALILFIMEIKITSFGLLTVGGIASLTIGSIMLIDSPFEFMRLSMEIIISVVAIISLTFIAIIYLAVKAHRRKPSGGEHALEGRTAVATVDFESGKGSVKIEGEIWRAESNDEIKAGDEAIVEKVDRLTLKVKKSI